MRKALKVGLLLVTTLVGSSCRQGGPKAQAHEEHILFGAKAFWDSAKTTGDGVVYIAGTLTGAGIGYENNTTSITCYHERSECFATTINQIGPNQVGRLESPSIYPIVEWAPTEVVASTDADMGPCRRVTITILRRSEEALWVEEPINQTRPECKDAEMRVFKWSIEDSPGWKALKVK